MQGDEQRYEIWRSQWRSGHSSQAIASLTFHGLYRTLILTGKTVIPAHPAAAGAAPQIQIVPPMINAAAQCARHLLDHHSDPQRSREFN